MLKVLTAVSGAVLLSFLSGISVADNIECKDYDGNTFTLKPKTITIYNNSDDTIYPVIATSKNEVNEWIQGCLRTTTPYPTRYVYKLYVNEGSGIAPNQSVTITLPLYSELSKGRYITWWNGGRVVLADDDERLRDEKDEFIATPSGVTCQGDPECKLTTYSSDVQFPENIYAQLSEYTFGDSIIPPKHSDRLLRPENVGYNISYVDHVYLPIAITPKNNPYIGYSGSAQSLPSFRNHLESFLKTPIGEGWPVYNLKKLKLPGGGGYNIFAQRSGTLPPSDNVPVKPEDGYPPVLTVLSCIREECTEEQKKSLHFGEAVQRMQNLWGYCVHWDEDISKYVTKEKIDCPQELKENLEAVKQFFKNNHEQYLKMHAEGKCNLTPGAEPVPFNYWELIKKVYGWVPFNEGCGAAANPLADTKIPGWDHAKMQSMYIHELQYNYKNQPNLSLLFNPYVQLIHDEHYLDMDAYGFSVDDAVGFMSELGDGLIFTVGGTHGLENKQQFNYADGFSVAIGVPPSMVEQVSKPLIKKYGVCVCDDQKCTNCNKFKQDIAMPDNSQIAGFRVGTVASYPIKVAFTDFNDNVYNFVVSKKFAPCPEGTDPSHCPTNKTEIVNKQLCSVAQSNGEKHPKSDEWCQNANPNQQKEKQLTKNFISFPQPVANGNTPPPPNQGGICTGRKDNHGNIIPCCQPNAGQLCPPNGSACPKCGSENCECPVDSITPTPPVQEGVCTGRKDNHGNIIPCCQPNVGQLCPPNGSPCPNCGSSNCECPVGQ